MPNSRRTGLRYPDPEQYDGVKWKVFYIIAPDRLCYWIGERQSDAQG